MEERVSNIGDRALRFTQILGKYQIIELLAKGGMAEVYKAKRYGAEGFEKTLVLKRILPHLSNNREFVELFINEAKIAMHLNHTNIVQVLDLDQENGEYFIVMEYVHGMNLAEIIKKSYEKGHIIPPELIAYIGSEAAKGLDYAHRRRGPDLTPLGIVHRDISPQNILVSYEGEVKVTDFGIAAAKHVMSKDEEGYVKGKYAYMAPEQALGEKVDARADIFSLGVILYEMAAGFNPFKEATGSLTIEKIIKHDFAPLSKTGPHIPAELSSIIEKSLEADPDKRYQNAGNLYEDLLAFVFTTGKTVSSLTLAQFISSLREIQVVTHGVSIEEVVDLEEPKHKTHEAQEEKQDIFEITNVAIPSPGVEKEEKPDLSVEQRELTLMSMEYFHSDALSDRDVERFTQIITNSGGEIIDRAKGYIIALYGTGQSAGKDLESSIESALKIKQLIRNLRRRDGIIVPAGFSIIPVRVSVDNSGMPIEDEAYTKAIVESREVAQGNPGKIIVCDLSIEEIGDKFEFEKILPSPSSKSAFNITRKKILSMVATRFINRKKQLQEIAEILAAANRGSGRVIGITGDAGTGKSRFIYEIKTKLSQKSSVFIFQVKCVPHLQTIPCSTMAQMLKLITGITEEDTEEIAKEKVNRLRELGSGKEEIEAVYTLLGILSERRSYPESLLPNIYSVFSKIARKLSQDRMTIFVWEDIRFMDSESLSAIDFLINEIAHSKVIIVLSYRTGFKPPFKNHPRFKEISLGPLSDADSSKLIRELLDHSENIPWEFMTEVITKSGGNPLFIEEYIKALKSSGAISRKDKKVIFNKEMAQIGLPRTLKGIFCERLSSLSDESKDILKVASVVGNRFGADILSEVLHQPIFQLAMTLEELENEGILLRASLTEYTFHHELFREAVYDSLPHDTRKNLHRQVATAIEASPSGKIEEVYNVLAHHWREGGNRKKAIQYLLKSADAMASGYHYLSALQQYLKAADLVRNAPKVDHEQLLYLYDKIGDMAILSAKAELGMEKMKLAADLAEEIGDRKKLVNAVTKIGRLATAAGNFSEAQRNFSRALELSKGLTDIAIRRDIFGAIGMMHAKNGEYLQAVGFIEEALKLSKGTNDKTAEQSYTRQLAQTLAAQGKKKLAMKYIEEAERQAKAMNDQLVLCELYKSRALVHFMLREFEQALKYSEKALEIAREYNFTYEIVVNSHNIGDIYLRIGNYKKAFTSLHFSYSLSKEYGFKKLEVINMAFLGFIDGVSFGSPSGIEKIKLAIRFASQKQYSWDVVQSKYLLGRAHFELKEYTEAREVLKEAVTLGKATGNFMYVEDSEKLLKKIEKRETKT